MTHSPEPWKLHQRSERTRDVDISDANDQCILETDWVPSELDFADYERIVACVNFCRQFPTAFLQGLTAFDLKHKPPDATSLADIPGFCGLIVVTTNQKEPT